MKRRTIFILFVLIFALALTLRLTGLVTESLWVDETYSISIATSHTVIADVITTEGTPFGYHYFLRYWIGLFGTSELSVRLPSVFFSLLSLVMIFLIGREIRDAKTGLIAATLFAVSLIDVVYAQEARIFALYGFLSLLMTYSTVKLVHLKSHFFAILYIISTILAFYVNYLAAPFVLLLTIYILWNNFSFRKWISLNFVIFVFCIPLFPIIQTQLATSMKGASARFVSIGLPLFLANLGTFIWLIPVLTIFFVASIFLLQKKKITLFLQKTPQWFYGGFLLIASFVLLYLIFNPLPTIGMRNPITHSFALIRHSLFFYPFLILFVSSIKLTSFKRIFYVCMGFFI
ncbi:TPA: hypothetical protein HA278_05000, partial [Candidatus Woesearchaeota archaeon]|nr:hypothetical protein [Candidatus Woesearchaeota archaeon]